MPIFQEWHIIKTEKSFFLFKFLNLTTFKDFIQEKKNYIDFNIYSQFNFKGLNNFCITDKI